MDISKYAEYVVKEKELPMSAKDVVEQELRKTFSRKYNAVCFINRKIQKTKAIE